MVYITITIPSDKVEEFKLGFLRANPKPEPPETDPPTPPMSDIDYLKYWIRNILINEYRRGKGLLAKDATSTPNPSYVDEVLTIP